jgi:hypothetical protein
MKAMKQVGVAVLMKPRCQFNLLRAKGGQPGTQHFTTAGFKNSVDLDIDNGS